MNKKLLKQIKEQVKAQIASVFSEDDINAQKKALEELLEESAQSYASLVEDLATRETEIADHIAKVEELNSKVSTLESEMATLKTDSEAASISLTEVTSERDRLKADIEKVNKQFRMESRIKELETSGILRSGEEAATKQRAFVEKLSDEEFAEYKEHLTETKIGLEEALKAALAVKDPLVEHPEKDKDLASLVNTNQLVTGKELASMNTSVKINSADYKAKFSSLFE